MPKLDSTSTPTVNVPSAMLKVREEVPMPPAKSKVIMPTPAPTEPCSTGPDAAALIARMASCAVQVPTRTSLRKESSVSPTTGITTSVSVPSSGYFWVMCAMTPAWTFPTEWELVSRMGLSSQPHSMTCVRPSISPTPLRTKPPATRRLV